MIKNIEVQKFKRFRKSIKIEDLSPVNYLIGKNNSGKSSFLQAILLSAIYRSEDGLSFNNSSFPEKFNTLREYFSDEDLSSPIKVVLNNKNGKDITIEGQWVNNSIQKNKTGGGRIPQTLYIPCNIKISMHRDKSSLNDIRNLINTAGILPVDHISSWVYSQERNAAGGTTWGKRLSKKFATFRDIINREFGIELLRPDFDDNGYFHFKYLEDKRERNLYLSGSGSQNVIYFIATIVYLDDYDLILIDEPELHLHPGIQKKLGNIFRKLSKEFNIQFIIATQSPFIVSSLTEDDSVYILKRNKKNIIKEKNPVGIAVAMELGGAPSDVGAPENFILLEEASMESLLRKVNDKIFKKNIQFISCSGINKVPDKNWAIENVINHNILLKCTPIYSSRYFIITDKLTKEIKNDERIIKIREKLSNRFIEMDFESLEDLYPKVYLEKFIENNKKRFSRIKGRNVREKMKNWIDRGEGYENKGERKRVLSEFVGENITKGEFKKIFSKLLKIFK